MKYKLITLLAASFSMVASGQETKAVEDATGKEVKVATNNLATSKVATSTAPVLKKFEGEKYAPTKLMGDPDYFIL